MALFLHACCCSSSRSLGLSLYSTGKTLLRIGLYVMSVSYGHYFLIKSLSLSLSLYSTGKTLLRIGLYVMSAKRCTPSSMGVMMKGIDVSPTACGNATVQGAAQREAGRERQPEGGGSRREGGGGREGEQRGSGDGGRAGCEFCVRLSCAYLLPPLCARCAGANLLPSRIRSAHHAGRACAGIASACAARP